MVSKHPKFGENELHGLKYFHDIALQNNNTKEIDVILNNC